MALSPRGVLGGRVTGHALEVGVCTTASAGFLLFGYDQGIMAGILTEGSWLSVFPETAPKNKGGAIQALVVAIYEIGCLLGSFAVILKGDRFGRRRAVLAGTLIMLIGTAIQASATTLAQMIVGRIVNGIGNGMNTSSIPVWQSEIAPASKRGFLVLFEGVLISAGIMISYWLNYGFFFIERYGSFQWRFPIAFQAFFAVLILVGVILYPESPRWLLKHGKDDEARQILSDIHDRALDDVHMNNDIDEIKKVSSAISGNSNTKLGFKEFLTNDAAMNFWRTSIAFAAQAFQQIGGINLVTYYATVVFEVSLGFDARQSRFLTGWLGTAYFTSATLALFVVDRLGRRKLMIGGALGMALALLGAAVGLSQSSLPGQSRIGAYVATAMFFIYNAFFALGWLGVTWLYPAEITPVRIRAEANGLSTAANWLFNFLIVQIAPVMIHALNWKTYLVFMCLNFAFIPVIYFTFVETKGYKLERIDMIFAEAHEKGVNPVHIEKKVRYGGKLDNEDQEAGEIKQGQ